MSLRDLKATDMVRVAAMHAEAQAEIVELRAERDRLRAENKQLQKFLRDANRGAELNSKVNRLLVDEQAALRAENERLVNRVAELESLVVALAESE